MLDSGKGQHCCLDSWKWGRPEFLGVDGGAGALQGESRRRRRRRNVYAGLCFHKAVIMSFTPSVWLSCGSLTHFMRRPLLGVVCGLTVPVDGGCIWGRGLMVKGSTSYDDSHSLLLVLNTGSCGNCLWEPVLFSHSSLRSTRRKKYNQK